MSPIPLSGGSGCGPPKQAPQRSASAMAQEPGATPAGGRFCASLCQKTAGNATNLRLLQRVYQTVSRRGHTWCDMLDPIPPRPAGFRVNRST
jgi:hypothetical protein